MRLWVRVRGCPSRLARLFLALGILAIAGGRADEPGTAAPEAAADTATMPIADFLDLARHPPLAASWSRLRGEAVHFAGGKNLKASIELRGLFSPQRSLVQLLFGRSESYSIAQTFADGMKGTSVLQDQAPQPGDLRLEQLGIRPGDLTLSFLYWDFEEELERDSTRAQACRVVILKHPQARERVKVWLTLKQCFPLKVVWQREGENAPYRELEFTGFEKVNDIWVIKKARLEGQDWKTMVTFAEIEARLVTAAEPPPGDLFRQTATP